MESREARFRNIQVQITPGDEIPLPLTGQSCFLAACPCIDTIVHLGPQVMASKDLDKEMAEGTPFGLKLRAIAKKVEALM